MAPRYTSMSHFLLAALLVFSNLVHASTRDSTSTPEHAYQFLPGLLSPRQEHSVALSDSQIFIIGGITSNVSTTPDTLDLPSQARPVSLVQSYSIGTQTWTNRSAFPIPVNHGNVAVVNDEVYLLGGLLGVNMTLWGAVGDAYGYDEGEDEWTGVERMPVGMERGACAVGVSGEEVWLAGGMRSLEIGPTGFQDSVALVSSYNTATNTWNTSLPPLPAARDHVGGAVIDRTFYVLGGRQNGQFNVRGTTWALDLDDVDAGWRELAPMPTPRGGLAVAAAGRCLYAIGGEGNSDDENGVFDSVEVYDTALDVWVELEPLWAGIHGTQAVFGGENDHGIYVPGGGYGLGGSAVHSAFVRVEVEGWCFE